MNSPAHWLSALVVVACLVIGLAGPLNPPSWEALYRTVPGSAWVYPAGFVFNAGLAAIGVWRARALLWSFRLCFGLFLIWGVAGLVLTVTGQSGGNWRGTFANFLCAGFALGLAYYVGVGTRGDRVNVQVVRLAEKVHQAEDHAV